MKFVLILEVLMTADGRTQSEIAKAAGMAPNVLTDCLSGRRKWNTTYVKRLATALKTDPEVLMASVSRKDIIDIAEERVKSHAAERARHLTPVADEYPLDDTLECIASIAQDDALDQVAIPIWPEEIAATGLASNDPGHGQEQAWVPASMRKIYGAKLRAVRVAGRSMVKAGILPGSVAFLRKSTSSKDGDIIVLQQDGGATLKRRRGKLAVAESDQRYSDIVIGDEGVSQGVVVAVYRPAK